MTAGPYLGVKAAGTPSWKLEVPDEISTGVNGFSDPLITLRMSWLSFLYFHYVCRLKHSKTVDAFLRFSLDRQVIYLHLPRIIYDTIIIIIIIITKL